MYRANSDAMIPVLYIKEQYPHKCTATTMRQRSYTLDAVESTTNVVKHASDLVLDAPAEDTRVVFWVHQNFNHRDLHEICSPCLTQKGFPSHAPKLCLAICWHVFLGYRQTTQRFIRL
jgi:hypothetical protein